MGRAIRNNRPSARGGERIRLHARLSVTTLDGKPVAPLARCSNIGMGGLRATAALGLAPGTRVLLAIELPSGRVFQGRGHVAWSKTTLHPALLGTPRGMDDDALFRIAFDDLTREELWPISRLLVARRDELERARRIRRRYGYSLHG